MDMGLTAIYHSTLLTARSSEVHVGNAFPRALTPLGLSI
jgi:hypothetical protein